jgi:RNA polymerase sigma-70 factor (ECF subfamily)
MSEPPADLGDSDLVARTVQSDREAFAQLYDRYARLVRAVIATGTRDTATVQDLTQETFLRAFQGLPTLRNADSFGNWVAGIARQVARENRRKRRAEPLHDEIVLTAEGTTSAVENADEVEHVLRLVGRLPEEERLAVHCFFLSERDVAQTARLLQLSRSGTYAVLKRACTRLAAWLGCLALSGDVNL